MLACEQLVTSPAANVLEKNATSNADLDQLGATARTDSKRHTLI